MARVDRLLGVTMAERCVSQLVSVDLTPAGAAGKYNENRVFGRHRGVHR